MFLHDAFLKVSSSDHFNFQHQVRQFENFDMEVAATKNQKLEIKIFARK